MEPSRISIIGIDGSDKSTAALRAIYSLSRHISICRIGRNPFLIWEGNISHCLPRAANFF